METGEMLQSNETLLEKREPSSRRSLLYASAGVVAGAAVSMLQSSPAHAHSQTAAGANFINVRDYGAVGNGVTLDTTAFNNAIAAASGKAVNIPNGTYLVGSFTIPLGVTLVFERGAILRPSGMPTITVHGDIEAGHYQIFELGFSFTETLTVNRPRVKVEWFGAKSAASFLDSGPQIQYAVNFCQSTRTHVLVFGAGYFYTNQTITITKPVGIIGQGIHDTTIFGGGSIPSPDPIFHYNGTTTPINDIIIGHMTIRDQYDKRLDGIRTTYLNSTKFEDLFFYGLHVAYRSMVDCWCIAFENITVLGCRYGMVLGIGSTDNRIYQSIICGTLTSIAVQGILNHLVIDSCDFESCSAGPIEFQHYPGTITDIEIVNCRFEKNVGSIGTTAGGNIDTFVFRNNYVENSNNNTAYFLVLRNVSNAIIDGNYFQAPSATVIDAGSSQNTGILAQNNRCLCANFSTRPQNTLNGTPHAYAINNGPGLSPSVEHGTAAPASGTYQRGSIVWHHQPASGGNAGWICTAAGTPGTWKTFGTIS